MALELSTELQSGVTGNYHKVTLLNFIYGVPAVTCVVALYKDAAARTAGKSILDERKYYWTGSDFTGWFDAATLDTVDYNPQERAYAKLKTLPEFTGATDV